MTGQRSQESTSESGPDGSSANGGTTTARVTSSGWRRTFATLRHRDFRMYWSGMLAYFMAMNMGGIARGWLAWELEEKAVALGVVNLAWGAPMVALSLYGGAVADRTDKRRLTLASQVMLFVLALTAAILVHSGVIQLWQLALLAFAEGTVFSFAIPARLAWVPELVGEDDLMGAIALNNAAMQATRVVGPGFAGALIAVPFFGLRGTFYLIACCYILVFLFMLRVTPSSAPELEKHESLVTRMLAGIRYIRDHELLRLLLIMAFLLVMLGAPFQIMLPVFAGEDVFDVGSAGLGLMATFAGIGATAAALLVGWRGESFGSGGAQMAAGVAFGVCLALFGLAPLFILALLVLALLGMTSTGYMVINNTQILRYAERRFHGRVMSVYMLTWSIMPVIAMPVSAAADAVGVRETVFTLGAALVVVLLALRLFYPGYHVLDEAAAASDARRDDGPER